MMTLMNACASRQRAFGLWQVLAMAAFGAIALWLPQNGQACASCSSGMGDPLILYPDEAFKIYAGMSTSFRRELIMPDGTLGRGAYPREQDTMVFSLGAAVTRRAFVTVTLPVVFNSAEGVRAGGVSDPTLAARYTLVQQSFTSPLVPQVQLVAGLRAPLGRSSVAGTAVRPDGLDQFGDGHFEGRGGIDLWYGMQRWKLGAAFFALKGAERKNILGVPHKMGLLFRGLVSLGWEFTSWARGTGVLVRDQQLDPSYDGKAIPNEGKIVYSLAASLDLTPLGPTDTLRLSIGRQAAFASFNATRDVSAALAYMKAF